MNTNQPQLPSGVSRVSIYPGDRPMFGASLTEALEFAERRAAQGKDEPLMLGAMREGYLGREMVTIDDLSRAIGEFDSAVEWVEIADAERYATENGMLR